MSCKPIIFSTPMVQAILAGRKTMTRRVVKEDRRGEWADVNGVRNNSEYGASVPCYLHRETAVDDISRNIMYPKYDVGDILWVREKWRTVDYEYCDCRWSAAVEYADGSKGHRVFWYDNSDVGIPCESPYGKTGWRTSIHMPKEAARLFLRVTGVRVERVQEIAFLDALDEGIKADLVPPDGWVEDDAIAIAGAMRAQNGAINAFRALWDSLNAKRGYGWDTNPWVWVYTFERVDKPAGWPGGEVEG